MPSHTYRDQFSTHDRSFAVPLYETDRVYTRDQLRRLFQRDYPDHIVTTQDVHNVVSGMEPYDHLPFPDMPNIPAEDRENHNIRTALINKHEEHREATRKARELYDVNGLEVFVPSSHLPSFGDDMDRWNRKAARIAALRTDDLNDED